MGNQCKFADINIDKTNDQLFQKIKMSRHRK